MTGQELREQRGMEIAARCKIEKNLVGKFLVPSQTQRNLQYLVDPVRKSCDCPDYAKHGECCKHVFAVLYVLEREQQPDGSVVETETIVVKKKTYSQNWPAYNMAQQNEKRWFLALLAELCRLSPEPAPKDRSKGGRPSINFRDLLFAAIFKVYSGFSARRFTSDLEAAKEDGLIAHSIHFNSVLRVLDCEEVTPILTQLVGLSASPLREIETRWAVDSTGFSGSKFDRWYDEKYGQPRKKLTWVKCHFVCGTTTNVIPAAVMTHRDSGDAPELPALIQETAKTFTIEEVAADAAYGSLVNFEAVSDMGGELYVMFKKNTTGKVGGLFEKAYHFFLSQKEEYLQHYHRRSMIESTISMVKRKFGDAVKAKTDTAMKNEALAKLIAHNLCCVTSAVYERGVDPKFLGLPIAA
jgi:transposase